ncbi:hypothetical protein HHK36_032766 [Tetracentron sinense]|uniref:Dynamin-type G domain-containing protein n=1 Tax=Tetracentron sinense TaxID=13715 RepID=A0A834Y6G7_TETSI|nr:hypothetical protein HHK36_032766 [Tetracentron sinense]
MTTEGVFAERVSGDVHSSSENSRLHNGNENHFNPYFLSNGDSPGIALVSQHLVGSENYNTWEISITVALDAKMKYGFVNGEIQMPAIVDSSYSSWKRVNSMVISWILNSVSKEIASSIIYMKSACEIWNDLKERFSEKNNPRIFQLKKAICGLNQDQMSVNSYFTKLKILWEEYSNYSIVPHCSNGSACAALKMMLDFQQKEYTMQFLMGLNDSYANLRSQILLNDPLPQINKVFASIIQEERQRNLSPLVNQVIEPVAYVSKLENGRNVGKNGSQGYGNSGNNSANQFQAASVQSNMSQGYQMQPTFSQGAQYSSSQNASDEAPVTQGQFQQLMALINNQFGSSNLVQNSPSLAQNSFSASACSSNDFSPFPYPQMTATQSQNSFPVPNKSSAQNQIPTIHNLSGNFFSILACLSALDNHSKPSKPYWIIDTGATNHMACSINFFHYATPVSNMSVKLPNGFIVPVTHDLIHWRMIGLGKRHGGLYILDQVSSKFSQSAHASVSFNASVSSEIWHYRLESPRLSDRMGRLAFKPAESSSNGHIRPATPEPSSAISTYNDNAAPLVSTYNDRIRPLLDAIDKLRHLKVMKEGIELPTIVVVGDQSSGKSSVLESLAGISLPRGQGICTRVPLIMRLQHHPTIDPELHLEYHGKIVHTDETYIAEDIITATDEIAGNKKESPTPLLLSS